MENVGNVENDNLQNEENVHFHRLLQGLLGRVLVEAIAETLGESSEDKIGYENILENHNHRCNRERRPRVEGGYYIERIVNNYNFEQFQQTFRYVFEDSILK